MDEGNCTCGRPECPDKLELADNQLFTLSHADVDQEGVKIVHGDQRSVAWHANRAGRIGGSLTYKVAANKDANAKLNSAKKVCYVAAEDNIGGREEVKWGNDHEPTAVYQYVQLLRNGTTIKVYSGPLELFNRKRWSKEAIAEAARGVQEVAVRYPDLRIDASIQVKIHATSCQAATSA